MNGIMQDVPFWPGIFHSAFEIHPFVPCLTSLFLFVADEYATVWATRDLFSYEGHVDHFKVGFEPGVEGYREMVTGNQEEGSKMLQAEGKQ